MSKLVNRVGRAMLVAGMAASLGGCGIFKGGKKSTTPVLGNRVPVLVSEASAKVDPDIASVPVAVPPAVANEAWA